MRRPSVRRVAAQRQIPPPFVGRLHLGGARAPERGMRADDLPRAGDQAATGPRAGLKLPASGGAFKSTWPGGLGGVLLY